MIRDLLGGRMQSAGGFCTEFGTGKDGNLSGCFLMPAAMAGGVEGLEKACFLDMKSFPPAHDNEVFRGLGVRLLEEAVWYPFTVLDEVGGIDLIIPQFRDALDRLLSSELPILGVLKSREDSELMRRLLGPGPRYTAFYDRLFEQLSSDRNTEIFMISEDAGKEAGEEISAWIAEYAAMPELREIEFRAETGR